MSGFWGAGCFLAYKIQNEALGNEKMPRAPDGRCHTPAYACVRVVYSRYTVYLHFLMLCFVKECNTKSYYHKYATLNIIPNKQLPSFFNSIMELVRGGISERAPASVRRASLPCAHSCRRTPGYFVKRARVHAREAVADQSYSI